MPGQHIGVPVRYDAARAAFKQRHPQFRLELLDALGQSRLADAKLLRCSADPMVLIDGKEVFERAGMHVGNSWKAALASTLGNHQNHNFWGVSIS
jgi:hypothetical protein